MLCQETAERHPGRTADSVTKFKSWWESHGVRLGSQRLSPLVCVRKITASCSATRLPRVAASCKADEQLQEDMSQPHSLGVGAGQAAVVSPVCQMEHGVVLCHKGVERCCILQGG